MTENEVIEASASHLRTLGWVITHQTSGNAHGIDIVAERGGRVLHVEAKGSATIRAGETVSHQQPHRANSAIAALGKAMMLCRPEVEVAIALPRERVFRNHVHTARIALRALGVTILWVSSDQNVDWSPAHELPDAPRRRVRTTNGVVADATCRADVLQAARRFHELGWTDFSPDDIVRALRDAHTPYAEATIRTHVVSVMCVDAPAHHVTRFPDLERIGRGRYRVKPASS